MTEAATEQTFSFKLVSPERILMDEPAMQVVVPGEEGDLGVLKGHWRCKHSENDWRRCAKNIRCRRLC